MNSPRILNKRNVQKLTFYCLIILLGGGGGGDRVRSLLLVFGDEIKHPQTVTFLWQIENIFVFFLHFVSF